jgi:hypothetical protein
MEKKGKFLQREREKILISIARAVFLPVIFGFLLVLFASAVQYDAQKALTSHTVQQVTQSETSMSTLKKGSINPKKQVNVC